VKKQTEASEKNYPICDLGETFVTSVVKKDYQKKRITQVQLLEKQDNCDFDETFVTSVVKKDHQKKE